MDTPATQHYQPVAQTPASEPLQDQPATPPAVPYLPTYPPIYAVSSKEETSFSSPNAIEAAAAGSGALAPWTHRSATLLLVILAALLQTALLAASIEIVANPVQYPTGTGVGNLSVKTFNVLVSILGSLIAAMTGIGLAIGVKSYICRRLVGDGISLSSYESFRRVGEARFPGQLSRYSILPLVVFAISTLSSPSVVSIWTASPERASFGFGLNYTSVTHNADYYQNRVANQEKRWVALHEEEYDGLVFALSRVANGNGDTAAPSKSDLDAMFTQVDGVNSSIANGIVPSLHQIANLLSRNDTELDPDMLDITRAASANIFKLQAPTTIATSTCTARTETTIVFGDWAVTGPTFSFNVTDTSCPGTLWTINLTDDVDEYASAISCMNTTSLSYLGYFFVNFTDSTSDPIFSPLASCYTSVLAGISSDITYTSLNRSYELSHATLAGGLDNGTDVDVTALSHFLVSREWASWTQFGRGSEALLTFAQNVYGYFDVDTTIDIYEILSRAMHAMIVTKRVAIDT